MNILSETLASPERLENLLSEVDEELQIIQPKIDAIEEQIKALRELKTAKQRLLTLKMSLSAILENISKDDVQSELCANLIEVESRIFSTKETDFISLSASKTFHPDEAFKAVDTILKQRSSLNYEMFKAVVFNGGKASTEEIKAYLVESGAKQPQTGEGFDTVPLTDISSRANYLVRKGVLQPTGKGGFYSMLGWVASES